MNRSRTIRRALVLGGLTLTLAAAGCGGEEKSEAPPAPAAVPAPTPQAATPEDAQIPTTRAQTQNPPEAGVSLRDALRAQVEVPPDYPSDAPVYPGSTASRSEISEGAASITFVTAADAPTVVAFIESDLASKGWGDVRTETMDDVSVTYGSKFSRKISVMTTRIEDADPVTMLMVAVDQ